MEYGALYVLIGAFNAAFFYWSLSAQDRMMGIHGGQPDAPKSPEYLVEAGFLWPVHLPMNLLLWAYVLIKSRKMRGRM